MGKKGSWFSSLKRTLSPRSKEKKSQKPLEERPSMPDTPIVENVGGCGDSHPFPPPEEVIPMEVEDEVPAAASGAAATSSTVATTTNNIMYSGKSMEEGAAIRIQTIFRGYLARRALWGLRGLVRLKTVVEGSNVKRQTANTLKCTKNLAHLQSQINSRRIRMSEENQALQRQRAKEIANTQNGDEWNDSVQSKEEMEAKLLSKYEATMRRERAMAYSFSHQQPMKKSGGTTNMLFMDPTNPQWGWSWSERYLAKDQGNSNASVKSGINITKSEIAKSYARHQLNSAPTTPRSKLGGPVGSRKPKPGPSPQAYGSDMEANPDDDDSKSVFSVKSEKNRRHSVAGSTLAGKSVKGKTRGQGVAENGNGAKKHLTFPAKARRHSGPPKVETTVCEEVKQEV